LSSKYFDLIAYGTYCTVSNCALAIKISLFGGKKSATTFTFYSKDDMLLLYKKSQKINIVILKYF